MYAQGVVSYPYLPSIGSASPATIGSPPEPITVTSSGAAGGGGGGSAGVGSAGVGSAGVGSAGTAGGGREDGFNH